MRSEFEVFRKEVEVDTRVGKKKYSLLPLSGRYYPKLVAVLKKFPQGEDAKNNDFLDALDEETISKLHELVKETLVQSLRITDKKELEELDYFVSQNLFQFIPALVEINMGSA